MQPATYFVFECYSGQIRLFASYGRMGTHEALAPLSDPDFNAIQKDAEAKDIRLSYCFVASGLEKKAAIRRLQELNYSSLQSTEVATNDTFDDGNYTCTVEWLSTCTSRLITSHAGRRGDVRNV